MHIHAYAINPHSHNLNAEMDKRKLNMVSSKTSQPQYGGPEEMEDSVEPGGYSQLRNARLIYREQSSGFRALTEPLHHVFHNPQ